MDSENNNTKRKKRKTRKCLNEIRKRSRNGKRCVVKNRARECHANILKGSVQNNKYLTINRLTLSMFTKAVRSETITRSALAEISNKPNLCLNDIVKDKNTSSGPNTNIYIEPIINDEQHNTSKIIQDIQAEENNHLHTQLTESDVSKSSSLVLQSPIYQEKDNEILLSNETETDPVESSSQRSLSSNFYDKSMINMTHLLRKQIKVTGGDVCQDFRENIHKPTVYISELNSPNDSLSIDSDDIDTVVQNPMEYIRLAQNEAYVMTDSQNSLDSTKSYSCLLFPLFTKTTSIIEDTPEYNYYPHKLKQ